MKLKQRPSLIMQTPRAGRHNHCFVVTRRSELSLTALSYIFTEVSKHARRDGAEISTEITLGQVGSYHYAIRSAQQLSGRYSDEIAVFLSARDEMSPDTPLALESALDEFEERVHEIDWDAGIDGGIYVDAHLETPEARLIASEPQADRPVTIKMERLTAPTSSKSASSVPKLLGVACLLLLIGGGGYLFNVTDDGSAQMREQPGLAIEQGSEPGGKSSSNSKAPTQPSLSEEDINSEKNREPPTAPEPPSEQKPKDAVDLIADYIADESKSKAKRDLLNFARTKHDVPTNCLEALKSLDKVLAKIATFKGATDNYRKPYEASIIDILIKDFHKDLRTVAVQSTIKRYVEKNLIGYLNELKTILKGKEENEYQCPLCYDRKGFRLKLNKELRRSIEENLNAIKLDSTFEKSINKILDSLEGE